MNSLIEKMFPGVFVYDDIGGDGAEIGIIMIPGANYPGERYIPLGR